MLIDLFLWGETVLAANIETLNEKIKYLTPFLKNEDFIHYSWIETGRIMVVGKLQVGSIRWTNHEAIIVNTNLGIRVVDASFASELLTINDWMTKFAPIDSQKTCVATTVDGIREINMEMIKESMGSVWNPRVPKCGYVFKQRLDAEDMTSETSRFWGTDLEKMISRKLSNYMELRLLPK